jgi:hypothetical protein
VIDVTCGGGLAKLDDIIAMERYLGERCEQEFFNSHFVDYTGSDSCFANIDLS